jgi:hypothetical protein
MNKVELEKEIKETEKQIVESVTQKLSFGILNKELADLRNKLKSLKAEYKSINK